MYYSWCETFEDSLNAKTVTSGYLENLFRMQFLKIQILRSRSSLCTQMNFSDYFFWLKSFLVVVENFLNFSSSKCIFLIMIFFPSTLLIKKNHNDVNFPKPRINPLLKFLILTFFDDKNFSTLLFCQSSGSDSKMSSLQISCCE